MRKTILFFGFIVLAFTVFAQENIPVNASLVPGTENLYIWNYSEYDTLSVSHSDAYCFCHSYGDGWRLPTTKELEYLWQFRYELNFSARHYWTSDKVHNKMKFYYVNFTNGKTGTEPYNKKNYVRCVYSK